MTLTGNLPPWQQALRQRPCGEGANKFLGRGACSPERVMTCARRKGGVKGLAT